MTSTSHPSEKPDRRPYRKPALRRIELTADETLAGGCKLGGVCDIPDAGPAFDGGS